MTHGPQPCAERRTKHLLAVIGPLAMTWGLGANALAAPPAIDAVPYAAVAAHPRWLDFVRALRTEFVEPVPEELPERICRQQLGTPAAAAAATNDPVSACIRAVLDTLGGPSSYTAPEEFAQQQAQERQGYIGIGLELARKSKGEALTVESPIAGGPGDQAGIRAGDKLLEIEGTSLLPLSMEDCVRAMRGDAGSVMHLVLQREGQAEPMRLAIVRQAIRLQSVRAMVWSDQAVYLHISRFNRDSAEQLVRQLRGLQGANWGPGQGLLLDLRGNQGGVLDDMMAVASALAPAGQTVIQVVGKGPAQTFRTGDDHGIRSSVAQPPAALATWLRSAPLAVLIDETSASGTEALAQFLKEARGARIFGQRSAGANTLRTAKLLGGDAMVALASGVMTSPSGLRWPKGLTPDEPLVQAVQRREWGHAQDPWLQAAAAWLASAPARAP